MRRADVLQPSIRVSASTVAACAWRAWLTEKEPPQKVPCCSLPPRSRTFVSLMVPALASIVVPSGTVDARVSGRKVSLPRSRTSTVPETAATVADCPKSGRLTGGSVGVAGAGPGGTTAAGGGATASAGCVVNVWSAP